MVTIVQRVRKWVSGTNEELEVRLKNIEESFEQTKRERDNAQRTLAETTAELQVHREKEAANKARYDSTEPWVEIKSVDYNDVRGFRIELDWNEAFVQHLKETGIKGANEEEVVQKWLAFLYQDLIEKLESKAIDKKDEQKTVSDYV